MLKRERKKELSKYQFKKIQN